MVDEAIWRAVLQPEPLMSDQMALEREDVQTMAMLRKLRSVGIADEELHCLLDLHQRKGSHEERIGRLRRIRFQLLANLHTQQQALDDLDYYMNALRRASD